MPPQIPPATENPAKSEPLLFLPLSIQPDQPLGQIFGRCLGFAFAACPVRTAELIQPGLFVVLSAADVLAHQVELRSGDIQAVAAGIGNLDVIPIRAVHSHL